MAKYVLSSGAARRLKEMMRGRMASGRVDGDAAHMVDEGGFEHPYKLTYAASAGAVDEQTGEAAGAWVIWLPDGCLVVDGVAVDPSSGLTAANNYPSGWYDLTGVLANLSSGATSFSLYLDVDSAEFKLAESDCSSPVLIASVSGLASGNKNVLQVVRSSIVIGDDSLYPWKVKLFDVESNGTITKHVGVWLPRYGCLQLDWNFSDAASSWTGTLLYIGCEKYSGSTLAAATAAESADGVWADLGVLPETVRWVRCELDPGSLATGRIWNLRLATAAPADVAGGATGNVAGYFHDLLIAKITADGSIEQYVTGCVCVHYIDFSGIGSVGKNDDIDVGGSGGIFPWTAETRTIGSGGCMVGRKWYTCTTGTGSDKPDGLYHLKVTLSASGASLEVVSGVSLGTSPSGTVSYIPIYQITNGKIAADYRGAFVVPCWE